jgi:hypothetical protein
MKELGRRKIKFKSFIDIQAFDVAMVDKQASNVSASHWSDSRYSLSDCQ